MTLPQEIVERVRSEYLEMPGMRLTPRQLQRLCGIGPALCDAVLSALVRAEFLSETPNGTFLRRGGSRRGPTTRVSSGARQPDLTVV